VFPGKTSRFVVALLNPRFARLMHNLGSETQTSFS
jgi:hypothetical protein